MHIPDGLLDPKTSAGLGFASIAVLGLCIAKVRAAVTSPAMQEAFAGVSNSISTVSGKTKRVLSAFGEKYLIKMGLVSSLIFAAQMFNFPIGQGTSGHLLGGVLAAVILGPFGGAIVMAAILTIQSIFFGDGGLLALGANILNMAVIGSIGGYYVY
ncbi:MAG: energy-coupling factor ABC transporter permease, partial [Candidatus Saganbacteria bacterium]|nr:energy-coupling factor ABC transporter permease [Candidatus Saganbacteria bacterium]